MKKNMGNLDRTIRIAIGILLIVLFFTSTIPGVLGIILAVIGLANVVFSFIGSCPVYPIFGWSTCNSKS
jgi:hypothetical protein